MLSYARGVTFMDLFLKKLFLGIYAKMKQDSKTSNYCKFNNEILTLFTSSLYIFDFFSSLLAFHATTRFNRLFCMRVGGSFVFVEAAIRASRGRAPKALTLASPLGIPREYEKNQEHIQSIPSVFLIIKCLFSI
ncbi:hypothetical protein IEQ34_015475 [Dendrobium chrysotoxum]|uniref:Uncharacterized protein n=1 Tax=Dendrobium chrysotoxum TaxID=161865 RepID=A0AAV7GIA3_DENCH|nr:hypothetical protein IEQ34_015475 [Dendrobium chrysotoxum]